MGRRTNAEKRFWDDMDSQILESVRAGRGSPKDIDELLEREFGKVYMNQLIRVWKMALLQSIKARLRDRGLVEVIGGNMVAVEQVREIPEYQEVIDNRRRAHVVGRLRALYAFDHDLGRHERALECKRVLEVMGESVQAQEEEREEEEVFVVEGLDQPAGDQV